LPLAKEQSPNILALGRAAERRAERILASEDAVHLATTVIAVIGILWGPPISYLACVAGLLTELTALWLRRASTHIRSLGREAMRRAMFVGANLITPSDPSVGLVADRLLAYRGMRNEAEAWYAEWRKRLSSQEAWPSLYWATRATDPADRLGDMLLESTIWWKSLTSQALTRSVARLLILVTLVLVAALIAVATRAQPQLSDVLVQVGLFIVGIDATQALTRWQWAADSATRLHDTVVATPSPTTNQAVAWLLDYTALTSVTPPIPSRLLSARHTTSLDASATHAVQTRAEIRNDRSMK